LHPSLHNTHQIKATKEFFILSQRDVSSYQKACFTSHQNNLLKDLFAPKKWKKKLVVHQRDVFKSEHQKPMKNHQTTL
jgi:hypothetical protein